ncbi:MAG TPA: hypothetical protein PK867_23530, partial [Pirellulales bacterium]|nr:hypothetical protein [Pirellulales bacterium]
MSEFIVTVPTQHLAGGGADMRSRLMTWRWRTTLPEGATRLTLDFSQTKFIEPWALALFAAYGLKIRSERRVPVTANLDARNHCNRYVRQMGLLDVLETGQSTPHWDASAQNTGLHVISDDHDVRRFVESARALNIARGTDLLDALGY